MSEELIEWLKTQGFDREATFKEIQDNEYDKESFSLASDDDLKQVCEPNGPLIKLKKCRDKLKSEQNLGTHSTSQAVVCASDLPSAALKRSEHCESGTPEFRAILKELKNIKRTLTVIPEARNDLATLFMQEEWIDIIAKPSVEELMANACERIKQKASNFETLVKMLNSITGLDQIVHKLREAVEPVAASRTSSCQASTAQTSMSIDLDFSCFDPPTQKDLMNVGCKVAARWKDIGTELGLKTHDLENIEANTSRCLNAAQEAIRQVFKHWYDRETLEFTWQSFVNALLSDTVGQRQIVRELYQTLSSNRDVK